MKTSVFAHHAHVFPKEVREAGTISRLLSMLDACDIERAVTFAPFAHQVGDPDFRHNRWLAGELENEPRLEGFGTVDFDGGAFGDQVKEIADLGLLGIKLHPAAQKFDVLGKRAMAVYEEAERLGLFLTFHTGVHWHRIKDYQPVHFDEVAHHFPNLSFSLEHVGGYHFVNEALAVIVNNMKHGGGKTRCNVYAGFTSVFEREKQRHWYLSPEKLKDVVWQVGEDQIIFGLDFPYNNEEETQHALSVIREELDLSPAAKQKILGGNLARVLGIETQQGGEAME